jgi:predicted GTPase
MDIQEEILALLNKLPAGAKLKVHVIAGRRRTGKSLAANALMFIDRVSGGLN